MPKHAEFKSAVMISEIEARRIEIELAHILAIEQVPAEILHHGRIGGLRRGLHGLDQTLHGGWRRGCRWKRLGYWRLLGAVGLSIHQSF